MTRYEIQDIVYQTNDGITFLALDRVAECKVALRRFFPFGQNNGGLDQGKQQAYEEVCEKLSEIRHPGFRSVMDGRADLIDGTPYMVTEWIDGDPLPKALGDQPMEHALVIDLVRRAIEVSIMVSDALGEESVWIDTTPRAVVVDNETSGRGFTFWICPFRWLGTYPMPKDIRSIAELAEELAGWKSKLYSENAGKGLGGWVKAMKQSPGLPLAEALQRLNQVAAPASAATPAIVVTKAPTLVTATATAPAAASAIATTSIASQRLTSPQKTTQAVQPVMKSASSGTSATKAAIWSFAAILIVTLISLAIYQNRSEVEAETARLASLAEISESELEALSVETDFTTKSDFTTQLDEGKSEQPEKLAINHARARLPQTKSTPKPASAALQADTSDAATTSVGEVFTPDDIEQFAKFKQKKPVIVRGTFARAELSTSGHCIYLNFSEPYQEGQIRGVVYKKEFVDHYDPATFDQFIGKEIIIDGKLRKAGFKYPFLVKIKNLQEISIVSGKSGDAPTNSSDKPGTNNPSSTAPSEILTPDDGDKIASLDAKTPVKVQGVLKVVKFWKNQTGQSGFTLFFSDPYQKGQIGGAISKGISKNKLDTTTFDPFIGKEIIIDGTSRLSSHDNSPRVDFTSISQISVVSK